MGKEVKEIPGEIIFTEEDHKYTDPTSGNNFTSVTTFVSKFQKPFNKAYWSMYTALKESGYHVKPDFDHNEFIVVDGINYQLESLYKNPFPTIRDHEKVSRDWKELADQACYKGNVKHNYLENTINKSKGDIKGKTNNIKKIISGGTPYQKRIQTKQDLDKTDLEKNHPKIYKRLKEYIKLGFVAFTEAIVYSKRHMIAGQIDVLLVRGSKFVIMDWKTNKHELHFHAGYYKKVNGIKTDTWIKTDRRLLYPLEHLQDCKGMLYTLQLSLYAYLLELHGFTNIRLELCHIRGIHKGNNRIVHNDQDRNTKFYPISYLKNEIDSIIKLKEQNDNRIKKRKNLKLGFR